MLAALVCLLATSPAAAQTITTLASFNGTNGSGPDSNLTLDAAGNLYGTTSNGGANYAGTIFKLTPASVPEPTSLLLLGLGTATLAAWAAWSSCMRAGQPARIKPLRTGPTGRTWVRYVNRRSQCRGALDPVRWASPRFLAARHHPTQRFRARLNPTQDARTSQRFYRGRL